MTRLKTQLTQFVSTLLLSVASASAFAIPDLSTTLTVDNAFDLYVSTDDSVTGALVGSNSSWQATSDFDIDLADNQTNYLHIYAQDVGVIAGVLGDFTLNNTNWEFSNGTQYLTTNTSDWGVNQTGFGNAYTSPISFGVNGSSPWGLRTGIDSTADWIWHNSRCTHCSAYFSTEITWVGGAAEVSAPAAGILFALSAFAVGLIRRRAK